MTDHLIETAPLTNECGRHQRRDALAIVAGAVVTPLLIWFVAHVLAGVDLTVGSGGGERTIGPTSIAVAGTVAAAAGLGLFAALRGRPGVGERRWTITALCVLVVSLLGPLGAQDAAAVLVLAAMHVSVGAIVIGGAVARERALDRR